MKPSPSHSSPTQFNLGASFSKTGLTPILQVEEQTLPTVDETTLADQLRRHYVLPNLMDRFVYRYNLKVPVKPELLLNHSVSSSVSSTHLPPINEHLVRPLAAVDKLPNSIYLKQAKHTSLVHSLFQQQQQQTRNWLHVDLKSTATLHPVFVHPQLLNAILRPPPDPLTQSSSMKHTASTLSKKNKNTPIQLWRRKPQKSNSRRQSVPKKKPVPSHASTVRRQNYDPVLQRLTPRVRIVDAPLMPLREGNTHRLRTHKRDDMVAPAAVDVDKLKRRRKHRAGLHDGKSRFVQQGGSGSVEKKFSKSTSQDTSHSSFAFVRQRTQSLKPHSQQQQLGLSKEAHLRLAHQRQQQERREEMERRLKEQRLRMKRIYVAFLNRTRAQWRPHQLNLDRPPLLKRCWSLSDLPLPERKPVSTGSMPFLNLPSLQHPPRAVVENQLQQIQPSKLKQIMQHTNHPLSSVTAVVQRVRQQAESEVEELVKLCSVKNVYRRRSMIWTEAVLALQRRRLERGLLYPEEKALPLKKNGGYSSGHYPTIPLPMASFGSLSTIQSSTGEVQGLQEAVSVEDAVEEVQEEQEQPTDSEDMDVQRQQVETETEDDEVEEEQETNKNVRKESSTDPSVHISSPDPLLHQGDDNDSDDAVDPSLSLGVPLPPSRRVSKFRRISVQIRPKERQQDVKIMRRIMLIRQSRSSSRFNSPHEDRVDKPPSKDPHIALSNLFADEDELQLLEPNQEALDGGEVIHTLPRGLINIIHDDSDAESTDESKWSESSEELAVEKEDPVMKLQREKEERLFQQVAAQERNRLTAWEIEKQALEEEHQSFADDLVRELIHRAYPDDDDDDDDNDQEESVASASSLASLPANSSTIVSRRSSRRRSTISSGMHEGSKRSRRVTMVAPETPLPDTTSTPPSPQRPRRPKHPREVPMPSRLEQSRYKRHLKEVSHKIRTAWLEEEFDRIRFDLAAKRYRKAYVALHPSEPLKRWRYNSHHDRTPGSSVQVEMMKRQRSRSLPNETRFSSKAGLDEDLHPFQSMLADREEGWRRHVLDRLGVDREVGYMQLYQPRFQQHYL